VRGGGRLVGHFGLESCDSVGQRGKVYGLLAGGWLALCAVVDVDVDRLPAEEAEACGRLPESPGLRQGHTDSRLTGLLSLVSADIADADVNELALIVEDAAAGVAVVDVHAVPGVLRAIDHALVAAMVPMDFAALAESDEPDRAIRGLCLG